MHTVSEVAKMYFDNLQAPEKKYYEFENSAHNPHLQEFTRYKNIMLTEVLKTN